MLPIIFVAGGADESSWRRPLKIIAGIVVTFSLLALFGSVLLSALGLPDDFLRWLSIIVLGIVGIGLIVPAVGHFIERPFYRLPKVTGSDSTGPFLLGMGLGTLYVPCAGPVLAAITVAGATGTVGWKTVVLTISFAIGAALPLLIFASAGANIRKRVSAYQSRQKAFRIIGGIVLLALAVGLAFNVTELIQRKVPSYTSGLEEKIAKSDTVQGALTPFETDENKQLSLCTPGSDKLAKCGPAPALRDTQRWLNTPGNKPLTLKSQRGKVVMLDFFAYSCINCQRDQPYIEKWYETYRKDGFVVIGIHSPEFAFEKDFGNLASAVKREGTTYPVVQDNQLANFTAYRNRYWPAKYLIDRDGTVRAIRFGEGGYDSTETLIRELLQEGGRAKDLPDPVTKDGAVKAAAERSPELYLAHNKPGYEGTPRYASTTTDDYTLNPTQPLDTYSLGGSWDVENQSITPRASGAQVRLHFRGQRVFHVLSGEGTVKVSRPGKPTKTIKVSGTPNLYTIIDGSDDLNETITLTYSKGISAYTFTFG